jgi:hypothetical protein
MTALSLAWRTLAVAVTCVVACSSRDQTLGETRRPPGPGPDPSVKPVPDPTPTPQPEPEPDPACQDPQKHVRVGMCVSLGTCFGRPINLAGYECPVGQTCCEAPVGCPQTGCGGSGSSSGTGAGGETAAGASG